jgi:hypothetical protein
LPTPYCPDPGSAIDVSFYGVIKKMFHQCWDETDAGHALRGAPEHAGTFDAMVLDLRPAKRGLGVKLHSSNPKTADVRFGSKADIREHSINVRFAPESGHSLQRPAVRFVPMGDIAAASAAILAGSKKSSHQETGAALQFRAS